MWLRTSYDLTFDIDLPTALVLMLRPRSGGQQWIAAEQYHIEPSVPVVEFTDIYGNLCQRLIAPPGKFKIHSVSEVMTADQVDQDHHALFISVEHLPNGVLNYLLPSRYCESDRFFEMASGITAHEPMGYAQVAAISTWLRENIKFDPAGSMSNLSAIEVNIQKNGVCRDLAHLGIALCRSLCIPARMVVGYLYGLEPMDMHAWFEAYVGNRWYAFDATQTEMRGGYVSVGYGRDAADVAVFNQFGPRICSITHSVSVELMQK